MLTDLNHTRPTASREATQEEVRLTSTIFKVTGATVYQLECDPQCSNSVTPTINAIGRYFSHK